MPRRPARAAAALLLAAPLLWPAGGARAQLDAPAAPASGEATTLALIRLLVEEGVISREKAQALLALAEQQAAAAAANRAAGGGGGGDAAAAAPAADPTPPGAVRVPYVPEVVRRQIRDEVKQEVLAQARTERWGDPGTLPDWIDRVRVSGDVRVRFRKDYFEPGNDDVLDFGEINDGDFRSGDTFFPTTDRSQDDQRLQLRARLALDAGLGEGFAAGIRLATGNQFDVTSTNEELGTALGNDNFNLDRAFLRYEGAPPGLASLGVGGAAAGELRAEAGRFGNPFFATDLLFDEDLNFDGLAGRYTYPVTASFRPFVAGGYFPLQYFDLSSQDRVLYAAQAGADWAPRKDLAVRAGLAYYDFDQLRGDPGDCEPDQRNRSRPASRQNGNTLFDISCEGDPLDLDDDRLQYGLASDFRVLNLTGQVDLARFRPIHVVATGDLAVNLAYNKDSVERRADRFGETADVTGDTGDKAYMARLLVGHPEIDRRHAWNTILTYKYVESDAVVDVFNDSDFHLGGTNAKGYSVFGNYGLSDRVALGARWYSADSISGPDFDVDTFFIELNARF